jgi:predicted hydrocarbon binding protein
MVLVLMDDEGFSKMVAMGTIKFNKGRIAIKGRTVVLVPAEVLILSYKKLCEEISPEFASKHFHELGKFQTETGSAKYYAEKKQLGRTLSGREAKGDPAFEMGRRVLRFAGYGDIEWVELFKDGEHGIVKIKNSPFAEEYVKMFGRANEPVCHYLRGLIGGIFTARYGKDYIVEEVSCKSTGKTDECTFNFRAKS